MTDWKYNSDDYDADDYGVLPAGKYRVRIADVEEKQSRAGNDMYVLTLDVSGSNSKLWYYMVFMSDNVKLTNAKLGTIFDSFGITPGDLNIEHWKGKVGACKVKHEEYDGEPQAKVHYFLKKKEQEKLPAWVEPEKANPQDEKPAYSGSNYSAADVGYSDGSNSQNSGFEEIPTPSDDDLPF